VVVDMPAVVARAERLSECEKPAALSFTADYGGVPAVDVFFSAGSIQYLDYTPAQLAARVGTRPRHIVPNKFALTSGPGFWTLQHLGGAMAQIKFLAMTSFSRCLRTSITVSATAGRWPNSIARYRSSGADTSNLSPESASSGCGNAVYRLENNHKSDG
jgi:putative methyltransferase (TIGR04325 family)